VSFSQGASVDGIVTVTATISGTPVNCLFVVIEVTEN